MTMVMKENIVKKATATMKIILTGLKIIIAGWRIQINLNQAPLNTKIGKTTSQSLTPAVWVLLVMQMTEAVMVEVDLLPTVQRQTAEVVALAVCVRLVVQKVIVATPAVPAVAQVQPMTKPAAFQVHIALNHAVVTSLVNVQQVVR
ncbi:MAG: hypothetical protein FJ009_18345 [Chloroflexi bacterium]|nr:hypothetical protein [Chloroflexota bacterium]